MPRPTTVATLFDLSVDLPDGFLYRPDFLTAAEEADLLREIAALRFGDVRMHGVIARRRIVQYGHNYSFDSTRISAGLEVPEFLQPLRRRIAEVARRRPDEFSEVLVTEYPPGAPIGWHRDAPAFDIITGVSLLSACRFQLRRYAPTERRSGAGRRAPASEELGGVQGSPPFKQSHVMSLDVEPRSLYILAGSARTDWEHHIPPTPALRYSITMRTLRRGRPRGAAPTSP